MAANDLFGRKCSLMLVQGDKALNLSELRIYFKIEADDEQSPNSANIRVYNLSSDTIKKIKGEYSRVVLQAGYEQASFGVIFDGTIKQFREGKEDAITTYLDILAADGDIAYNYAVCSRELPAGTTPKARLDATIASLKDFGVTPGKVTAETGGILPRGKVLFGMARVLLRQQTQAQGSTWNISNGEINVVPLTGYLPGEAVVLTSQTGLLGRPEQTQEGIKARCLMNPRIQVAGLVKIDNASINKTIAQKDQVIPGAQLPYNQWAGLQQFADISADGLYRVYVIEMQGDTRGASWWMDLTLLAVDPVTLKVMPSP